MNLLREASETLTDAVLPRISQPKPCCYISFDQLVVEVRFSILESRNVEALKAVTEKLQKEEETNKALKETNEALKRTNQALYRRNERAYQELLTRDNELDRLEKIVSRISGGARSTSWREPDEGYEDTGKLKEDVASLIAQNKDLQTRLGRESGKNADLTRRFDAADAYVQHLKDSIITLEKEARQANEARFQAITEASDARREAEASAEAARLELDAKFKEHVEATRNETSIATARGEAVILENASLKRALVESEEKLASVQKEADAALANLESQLNAEKLNKENLARDYERALALKTEAKVEVTPPNFELSENSLVPVQPSGEAAVPTPVAEPESSPAEDGLVPSSAPAATSNPSGQSWLKPLGFTIEAPRATSFPTSEPGHFGISFGKESTEVAKQKFDAVASCGGTDNSKSDSMEASDATPSSTNSSSIFGTGPATLPTPFN
ncbi:hypothetical protein FRC00_014110, partial [Tulasnella sp. 408]